MPNDVFVVGSSVSRFGRYDVGSGRAVASGVAVEALESAGLRFDDVDGVWAGVALGDSPRAVFVAKELGLTGVSVQQVVNASASGLAAVHDARMAIMSGEHDLVLVLGYDVPDRPASAEGAIALQGFLPPASLFGLWAEERRVAFGTDEGVLALVAAKNWNYARQNPFAQRRSEAPVTTDDILRSRPVAGMLTAKMCTPWGEGAAALVLASERGLERVRARDGIARVRASVLQSEVYGPLHAFEGAVVGPPEMTTRTAVKAFDAAQRGPADVDVLQVHDAFANEELEYIELMGFAERGGADQLIRDGAFGPGSRERFGVPEVSTDGGLIARGHASGATGVAQIHETRRRFAQHGDRLGVCQLLGAGSVCVVQIYERCDE